MVDPQENKPVQSGVRPHRQLLYIGPETDELRRMTVQAGVFGVELITIPDVNALSAPVEQPAPALVICSTGDVEAGKARFDRMKTVRGMFAERVPVVALSSEDNLAERLGVVRAGGSGLLVPPFSTDALIELLDHLVGQEDDFPPRALVLSSSVTLGSLYAVQLERSGMEVELVSDLNEFLTILQEFGPDLVVMDTEFDECNAAELSQVVRQSGAAPTLPVLIVAEEGFVLFEDDVFTRKVTAANLVRMAYVRAERFRAMRRVSMMDGVTGLLNPSAIRENLVREFLRAKREKTSLCLAVLDLDRFKQINDQFGHAAGDRIMRSLAYLLRQRLRRSDIIGRLAGEEFAVLLPNTSLAAARILMDDLRLSFSRLRHPIGQFEIALTFSCGLAAFPGVNDATDLLEAAGMGLRRAKDHGRNRVMSVE